MRDKETTHKKTNQNRRAKVKQNARKPLQISRQKISRMAFNTQKSNKNTKSSTHESIVKLQHTHEKTDEKTPTTTNTPDTSSRGSVGANNTTHTRDGYMHRVLPCIPKSHNELTITDQTTRYNSGRFRHQTNVGKL